MTVVAQNYEPPIHFFIFWASLEVRGPTGWFISKHLHESWITTEARLGTTTRRDLGTTTRSPSARRTSRRRAGANIWETLSLGFSEFCFCEDLEKVSGEMDRTKERFWINQSSEKRTLDDNNTLVNKFGSNRTFSIKLAYEDLAMLMVQKSWQEPPMEMYIKKSSETMYI